MPTLRTDDGVDLHYEEVGSGTPLVFVHEFAGDVRSWEPQLRFFGRRYRCVAFNARGYPPSAVPNDPKAYSQARATDGSVRVFVNGRHVPYVNDQGQSSDEFNGFCQPVSFDITDALLPDADNQITLRCERTFFNELGTGGLLAPVSIYQDR